MSEQHDPEAPEPLEGAQPPGAGRAAPGGGIEGEGGIARGVPGEGDLAGDADMGGGAPGTEEDPLRTETAGGS